MPSHSPTSNGCVPLSAHPCPNLTVVLVFSRLMGMKWYFTTVLFCLSPANLYFFREKTHNHHLMTMARRLGVVMGQVFYPDRSLVPSIEVFLQPDSELSSGLGCLMASMTGSVTGGNCHPTGQLPRMLLCSRLSSEYLCQLVLVRSEDAYPGCGQGR